jgi:hypothetical protein
LVLFGNSKAAQGALEHSRDLSRRNSLSPREAEIEVRLDAESHA